MWTLEQAVNVVQAIEPSVRKLGYHTCLGGGVLHKGSSDKDIDLFFLKLHTDGGTTRDIVMLLQAQWGEIASFFDDAEMVADYAAHTHPVAAVMGKIEFAGKRIDVFIQ